MVAAAAGPGEVAAAYLWLGVEHILLGVDHLLFVLALLMLVRGWKRIVLTVTAFTVAHSITLAAATLGFVHVPGPPVEATIALSIVFVAAEIVNVAQRPAEPHRALALARRLRFRPAARVRLRRRAERGRVAGQAIPLALLFFNVGVELGQLAFVAAVMALFAILRRIALAFVRRRRAGLRRGCGLAGPTPRRPAVRCFSSRPSCRSPLSSATFNCFALLPVGSYRSIICFTSRSEKPTLRPSRISRSRAISQLGIETHAAVALRRQQALVLVEAQGAQRHAVGSWPFRRCGYSLRRHFGNGIVVAGHGFAGLIERHRH